MELVRRVQPGTDVDLVRVFRDDDAAAELIEALRPLFHPDFECARVLPTYGPQIYNGLDGLRAGWLDWLEPWATYRAEIADCIDAGDRVLVLVHDFGTRDAGGREVPLSGAAVWTVRDGKIARAAFYIDRSEAFDAVGLPNRR